MYSIVYILICFRAYTHQQEICGDQPTWLQLKGEGIMEALGHGPHIGWVERACRAMRPGAPMVQPWVGRLLRG